MIFPKNFEIDRDGLMVPCTKPGEKGYGLNTRYDIELKDSEFDCFCISYKSDSGKTLPDDDEELFLRVIEEHNYAMFHEVDIDDDINRDSQINDDDDEIKFSSN